jgi:hypothetical protein
VKWGKGVGSYRQTEEQQAQSTETDVTGIQRPHDVVEVMLQERQQRTHHSGWKQRLTNGVAALHTCLSVPCLSVCLFKCRRSPYIPLPVHWSRLKGERIGWDSHTRKKTCWLVE